MEGDRLISHKWNFYIRPLFEGYSWIKTLRKRRSISTEQSWKFWKVNSVALHRYTDLVLGRDRSYFIIKKTPLILPKSSLKLISKCSSFWLTTYLLCLVDMFLNRQSAYLWVQIVLLFSSNCSFIRTRQICS